MAVKIEKEEAVKVETDISTGPDYRGSIVPGLFIILCHQKQTRCHRGMSDGCQSQLLSPSVPETPAEIWPSGSKVDLARKGLTGTKPRDTSKKEGEKKKTRSPVLRLRTIC